MKYLLAVLFVTMIGLALGHTVAVSHADWGDDIWEAKLDNDGTLDTQHVFKCTSFYPAITWAEEMAGLYSGYDATADGDGSDAFIVIHTTDPVNWSSTAFYPGFSCGEPLATGVNFQNFSQSKYLYISF